MNNSEWNIYATIYDDFYMDRVEDLHYLSNLWKPTWNAVLEIGAGSGRMIPFFEKQGVTCYSGVDTSSVMLELAAQKGLPEGFELIHGNLLEQTLNTEYDLIIYSFHTANYIFANFEQQLALCANNLREGGIVFLDILLPLRHFGGEEACQFQVRKRRVLGDIVVELWGERLFDHATNFEQRHHTFKKLVNGQIETEFHFKTERRFYAIPEIEKLAASAGLKVDIAEEYGTGHVVGYYVVLTRED